MVSSSIITAAADFHKQLDSDLLTVYIGYSKKTYHLPRALLGARSERCRRHSFVAGAMYIQLHGDDVEAFNLFVFWLYRDSLPAWEWPEDTEASKLLVGDLCTAWLAGAISEVPGFQNCVVENLCDAVSRDERCVSPQLMNHVYLNTAPRSALRRLLVDVLAVRLNHYEEDIDCWEKLHTLKRFAADLHHADRWYWENLEQNFRYEKAEDGGDRKVCMVSEAL